MTDTQVYAGAAAVGALAGIRSLSGPTLASEIVPPETMPVGPVALRALALGELVIDKLPFMPDRTSAIPLIGRAVMGGLSGGAICASKRRSVAIGAALGVVAAIGVSYLATRFRKKLSDHMPGAVVGVLEDLVVTGAGALIASNMGRKSIPSST